MNQSVIKWVSVLCLINYVISQTILNIKDKNPCIGTKLCGDCIAVGKDCAWCLDPSYAEENKDRCNLIRDHTSCPAEYLISPSSTLRRTLDKEPVDGTKTENPIQLQPQVINLKIRPNDPQNFTLKFRLANNYPVDLYYLMDLSYSMKDDKDELAKLGVLIANEMNNITENFRLGFGSFVDKTVMPYICITKNNPSGIHCPRDNGEDLDPTYGFKNQLPLTDDPNLFQQKVRSTKMSGNLDAPEGGLDAVMQAITCETQIGWRTPSRRMLLYSSDSGFHIAGDGKLGGIIKPNDGECHLINDMYSENNKQDYPSISQIAAKIEEKNVNLIFAVTENQVRDYSRLEKVIPGSETGTLAGDSSNIVTIVRDNYEKITSKVEMSSFRKGSNVNVRYFTNCKEKGQELRETHVCEGLKVGDSVSYEVEITVTECPKDSEGFSQTFDIKPVGLSDKLEVRMEVICECDCENDTMFEQNKKSPMCNYHGSFVCGACDCEPRYYGKTCNCFIGNETEQAIEQDCIAPNTTEVCSGRGQCVCGTCECNKRTAQSVERYSGKWCQCDSYSCPFYNGALCGGASHGVCNCGRCECLPEFTGENCGCSTKTDSCVASDGSLCGGPDKGECLCNRCVCNPESKYQGSTCEDCKDCTMICRQHRACVQCVAYGTGELKNDCGQCKVEEYITVKNDLPEGYNSCEFKDEDDCIFYFTYKYDENNKIKIIAKQDRECPSEVNVLYIILGVVIGIVVVGIALLLIWKLFTHVTDKRELARFNKETEGAKWDTGENPVYIPAVSHYQNPTYSGPESKEDVKESKSTVHVTELQKNVVE